MERLEKLVNKYERMQIQHIDWLDRLTFKAMDGIKERESCRNGNSYLYLVVDFCGFEHRVVFQVVRLILFSLCHSLFLLLLFLVPFHSLSHVYPFILSTIIFSYAHVKSIKN